MSAQACGGRWANRLFRAPFFSGPRWRRAALLLAMLSTTWPLKMASAADLYGSGSDLDSEVRNLLSSSDAEKRRLGIEKLAGQDLRVAAAHLVARLSDQDGSVRARAARALGPAALQEAAALFIAGLSDAESSMRSACAEALGQYGALPPDLLGRAAATLGRALGDTQYEVRIESLRAILRLLHARVFGLVEAQQLLASILLRAEDEHVGVRHAAVRLLGAMGEVSMPVEPRRRAVVALLGRLSDSARDVRADALASLAALGASEAAKAALRLLQDPAEEVRRQALLYLGQIAYAAAVPVLAEIFANGEEGLRKAAAQALSGIASGPALEALCAGLSREEWRGLARVALLPIGAAAVPVLLGRMRQGGAGAAEMEALVDLLRDISGAAAKPLPAPLQKQILEELSAELDRGRVPREHVIDALSKLIEPSATRLLVGLLFDKEVSVRRHAVLGLRQQSLLDQRALDALSSATRDEDREVRTQATLLLALLPARTATPRLFELLGAEDGDTRRAAAQALGHSAEHMSRDWQGVENAAVPALVTALRSGPGKSGDALSDLRARRAAAQALFQVVSAFPAVRAQAVSALLSALRRGQAPLETWPELLSALGNVLRGDAGRGASLRGEQAVAVRKLLWDLAQVSSDSDSLEAALALQALDALAAMRDYEAAERIGRLLGHRDPLRKMRAASALGTLLSGARGDSPALALFAALKEETDSRVVAEVAWALGKLPRETALAKRAGIELRQLLSGSAPKGTKTMDPSLANLDRAVRINTLGALVKLGQAQAEDAQWLQDGDASVRQNAVLLVTALPALSPGMQARLRNVESADADHRVREIAERALRAVAAGAAREPFSKERFHFLTIYPMSHDDKPLVETAYRLIAPDGLVRVGITDRRGIAREELLPPGICQVELFTDLVR